MYYTELLHDRQADGPAAPVATDSDVIETNPRRKRNLEYVYSKYANRNASIWSLMEMEEH